MTSHDGDQVPHGPERMRPVHPSTLGYMAVLRVRFADAFDGLAYSLQDDVREAEQIKSQRDKPLFQNKFLVKIDNLLATGMSQQEAQFVDRVEEIEVTPEDYMIAAQKLRQEAAPEVAKIRDYLSKFSEDGEVIFNSYCSYSVPNDHPLKVSRPANKSWHEWFTDQEDDTPLLSFLDWHVGHIEQQQANVDVRAAVEVQKELYKLEVAAAIEEGWLHPDAKDAIKKVDDVNVYIGDLFDTLLQERGGYHQPGTNDVVIAAPYNPNLGENEDAGIFFNIEHAGRHEFNHAVLGTLGGRGWLDEALTEHIAVALKEGKSEILDPDQREVKNDVYCAERRLLNAVLNTGAEIIPVSLATRAYSTGESVPQDIELFSEAIIRAWPDLSTTTITPIQRIKSYIGKYRATYMSAGWSYREAEKEAVNKALSHLGNKTSPLFDLGYDPSKSWGGSEEV